MRGTWVCHMSALGSVGNAKLTFVARPLPRRAALGTFVQLILAEPLRSSIRALGGLNMTALPHCRWEIEPALPGHKLDTKGIL